MMVFSTRGYFLSEIASLKLPISKSANVYLGDLFERMIQIDRFYGVGSTKRIIDRSYGLLYLELLNEGAGACEFQQLGDSVLFYSSGFREQIRAKGISFNYFCQIGSASYLNAFQLGRAKLSPLREISENFSLLADRLQPVFGK